MCDNCGCDATESQKGQRRDKTAKHGRHVHADGAVHSHEHDHEHGCMHPHNPASTAGGRCDDSASTDKSDRRQ